MLILFFILFKKDFSNIKIKERNILDATLAPHPTQTPVPTQTPIPTRSPTPSVSPTPPPSSTPTKSFEIIVMNPLQSNAVSPTLSVIAVISLAIGCTAGVVYIIFYILPFMREDLSPLL